MTVIDVLLLVVVLAAGVGVWSAVSKSKRVALGAGLVGASALLVLAGMLLALNL